MIECICCKELHDEQYISKYETLDKSAYIKICETCYNENSEYDEIQDMSYINLGKMFYPSD